MKLTKERQGELFISLKILLWSLFPVITILSYKNLSPLVSLAGSTLFSVFFFAGVLTIRKKWHELKNRSALRDILFATFFAGILYYLFYFFGLQSTSAGNASIIALTEIFFSYLFFHVWRGEHLPIWHALGATLVVLGALIVLFPNLQSFKGGEFLIIGAAISAPFANYFQQRARKAASSEVIMFIRSLVSTIVIFILIVSLRIDVSLASLKSSIVLLLISGVFLFGLVKILWIEGIHRISVVKSIALSST